MNIRPISDLRNYKQVLQEVTNEQPFFCQRMTRGNMQSWILKTMIN